MTRSLHGCALVAGLLIAGTPISSHAQSPSPESPSPQSPPPQLPPPQSQPPQPPPPHPTGRVSVYIDTAGRDFGDGGTQRSTELSTAVTFESPRTDENGLEYGLDLRQTRYSAAGADRVSIYDGFAGARFGGDRQLRMRAGHIWMQDLGTMGALAGGLFEVGQRRPATEGRYRLGVFGGLEPNVYEAGYARDVRKYGGYAAYEQGFMRRHVVGYTTVKQGDLTERSVLSFTNFVPAGQRFFAYQAAEYEVKGPADGLVQPGLSYFLTNARLTASSRVELNVTYNRGRALDARQLTSDMINGRALTAQAVEGLKYESAGGRVTVEVVRRLHVYAGYTRDRNNREDAPSARILVGGHAGNVFGTGFDISGSDSRIDRVTGPYHSSYVSIGHSVGRSMYASIDYSTSLSIVHFLSSDGVMIETKPSTRRFAGSTSITLNRSFSLLGTIDYTIDDTLTELRVMSGLSYRIR
ncbi:MAG TPA: hypothetical protein VKB50_16555 [Vicinamibacterales bacterium]|nr:hypothetical protein [Vicinamibacterales bacterium]